MANNRKRFVLAIIIRGAGPDLAIKGHGPQGMKGPSAPKGRPGGAIGGPRTNAANWRRKLKNLKFSDRTHYNKNRWTYLGINQANPSQQCPKLKYINLYMEGQHVGVIAIQRIQNNTLYVHYILWILKQFVSSSLMPNLKTLIHLEVRT